MILMIRIIEPHSATQNPAVLPAGPACQTQLLCQEAKFTGIINDGKAYTPFPQKLQISADFKHVEAVASTFIAIKQLKLVPEILAGITCAVQFVLPAIVIVQMCCLELHLSLATLTWSKRRGMIWDDL